MSSNPGGKVYVIRHESRPQIKITPPENASDRKIQTFNYIEATKNLPTNFNAEEREIILKSLSPKLTGKVRAIFSVISDDMVKKRVWKAPTSSEAAPSTGANSQGIGRSSSSRNHKRGPSPSGSSGAPEKHRK